MNITRSLAIVTLLFTLSCKKKPNDPPKEDTIQTGKVTIAGQEYSTVKIGNQIWTTDNYKGTGGIAGNKATYGRYYTFDEMRQLNLPQGWRVPTETDYQMLVLAAGIVWENGKITNPQLIKKLASTAGWKNIQGNNALGFNLYPGGYSVNNSVPADGDLGELWIDDGKTFCIMEGGDLKSHRIIYYAKSANTDRFNLRVVRDVP